MTLTVSQDGQVTFPREALEHLGVGPGGQIALDLLPDGRGTLHSYPRVRTGELHVREGAPSFIGMFKTDKQVSIEEMNETIAMGWAGLLDDDGD